MRLTDTDKLLKLINEQKVKETGAYTKGLNAGLNIVKSIVNDEVQTPTAYDVDKVIEQLEKLPRCSSWNHNSNNIDRIRAIEIVKVGGCNDD